MLDAYTRTHTHAHTRTHTHARTHARTHVRTRARTLEVEAGVSEKEHRNEHDKGRGERNSSSSTGKEDAGLPKSNSISAWFLLVTDVGA